VTHAFLAVSDRIVNARQLTLQRMRRSAPCALVAIIVAVQFLFAFVMASNDEWHCECCPDAGTDQDQCLVALLLSGSITVASIPPVTFESVEWTDLPWPTFTRQVEVSWLSAFSVLEHAPPVTV
jgi:hypothetical protein